MHEWTASSSNLCLIDQLGTATQTLGIDDPLFYAVKLTRYTLVDGHTHLTYFAEFQCFSFTIIRYFDLVVEWQVTRRLSTVENGSHL